MPAQLITAKAINPELETQLVAALKKAFAKEVVFEHEVDPSPISYTHLDVYKRQILSINH